MLYNFSLFPVVFSVACGPAKVARNQVFHSISSFHVLTRCFMESCFIGAESMIQGLIVHFSFRES